MSSICLHSLLQNSIRVVLVGLSTKAEGRRRQPLEQSLQEPESRHLGLGARVKMQSDQGVEADSPEKMLDALRGEISRARARAALLEEQLEETVRSNRRLEKEVAQAVQHGVSAPVWW